MTVICGAVLTSEDFSSAHRRDGFAHLRGSASRRAAGTDGGRVFAARRQRSVQAWVCFSPVRVSVCRSSVSGDGYRQATGSGRVLCQAVAFFAARWFQAPPVCFLSRQLPSMRLFLNRSTRYMFIEVVNPCLFRGTRFQDISDPFRCPEDSESPTP